MIKCESESLRLRLRPNDELAKFKLQALHTYKENRLRKGHDVLQSAENIRVTVT
jgi:hypothetical protein